MTIGVRGNVPDSGATAWPDQMLVSSAGTRGSAGAAALSVGLEVVAAESVGDHGQRAHRVAVDQDVGPAPGRRGQTGDVEQRDEVVRRRRGQAEVGWSRRDAELGRGAGHDRPAPPRRIAGPSRSRRWAGSSRRRRRLCTTLPLPTISTPRRRAAGPAGRRARGGSRTAASALIDSWTTGMSASGKTWTSTDQVPWSMPQLSRSRPTQVGLTTSATSSASAGSPGRRILRPRTARRGTRRSRGSSSGWPSRSRRWR